MRMLQLDILGSMELVEIAPGHSVYFVPVPVNDGLTKAERRARIDTDKAVVRQLELETLELEMALLDDMSSDGKRYATFSSTVSCITIANDCRTVPR